MRAIAASFLIASLPFICSAIWVRYRPKKKIRILHINRDDKLVLIVAKIGSTCYLVLCLSAFYLHLVPFVGNSRASRFLLFSINVLNLFSVLHCYLNIAEWNENMPTYDVIDLSETANSRNMNSFFSYRLVPYTDVFLECAFSEIVLVRNLECSLTYSHLLVECLTTTYFNTNEWRINVSRVGAMSKTIYPLKTIYHTIRTSEKRILRDALMLEGKICLLYVWCENGTRGMKLAEIEFFKRDMNVISDDFVISAPNCFANKWCNVGPFCIFYIGDENRIVLLCNRNVLVNDYFLIEYRKNESGFYSVVNEIWLNIETFAWWNQIGERVLFLRENLIQRLNFNTFVLESFPNPLKQFIENKPFRESLPTELIWKKVDVIEYGHSFFPYYWRTFSLPLSLKLITIRYIFVRYFESFSNMKYYHATRKYGIMPEIALANCCGPNRAVFLQNIEQVLCYAIPMLLLVL